MPALLPFSCRVAAPSLTHTAPAAAVESGRGYEEYYVRDQLGQSLVITAYTRERWDRLPLSARPANRHVGPELVITISDGLVPEEGGDSIARP